MADPRQCPACGILPALSGEPNCDCWQEHSLDDREQKERR